MTKHTQVARTMGGGGGLSLKSDFPSQEIPNKDS